MSRNSNSNSNSVILVAHKGRQAGYYDSTSIATNITISNSNSECNISILAIYKETTKATSTLHATIAQFSLRLLSMLPVSSPYRAVEPPAACEEMQPRPTSTYDRSQRCGLKIQKLAVDRSTRPLCI